MKSYPPASLDEAAIEKVHRLEQELGKVLVAYEQSAPIADLSKEQLEVIAEAERKLGKVLVAYDQ